MNTFRSVSISAIVALVFFSGAPRVHAQPLTRDDFRVGIFDFDIPFDSIAVHLNKPDSTWVDDLESNFIGLYFPKFTVFKNTRTNRLSALHIYDSSFVTRRGLRVGDSLAKAESLYQISKNETRFEEKSADFDLMGFHDYHSFHDYTSWVLLDMGDYHLVLFAKGKALVKLVFYTRVNLEWAEYNVGVLTLDAPIGSILAKVGKPDSTAIGRIDCMGYYFPKFIIWRDTDSNTLCAADIYDPNLVTSRGIRVGDSVSEVDARYHDVEWHSEPFDRLGPYDEGFRDYNEQTYMGGSRYLVFFAKDKKIVKILSYVGINE